MARTELQAAVIDGQVREARALAEAAVQAGAAPGEVFRLDLSPAMAEVGRLMQMGEYFLPEVLASARAMKAAAEVMRPWVVATDHAVPAARVVIGTVQGDLHDIGKNLVAMLLEGAGFEVVDLGIDVPVARFVDAVAASPRPQVLAMSAMLTTTMMQMGKVVQALEDGGLRGQVRVLIGGAPVTERFATEIGADGFALDAAEAPGVVRSWSGMEEGSEFRPAPTASLRRQG